MALSQMPAATPRDIFQSVDPSQFLMTPQQESERQSKQQQVMIANILSNQAGNAANFFKPGSYDMGAQAKVFDGLNRMTDEPIAALGRKQNATQQAETIEQRRLVNEGVRAKMDPASDVSKGLRSQVAETAKAHANMLRSIDPNMAAELESVATNYLNGSQSGTEAEAQMKSLRARFGETAKLDYNRAVAGNQAANIEVKKAALADSRDDKEKNRQERALERAQKRQMHDEEMAFKQSQVADKAASTKLKLDREQEKLNREVSDHNNMLAVLKKVKQLKTGLDTGPLAEPYNRAKEYLGVDVDKKRVDMRSTLRNGFEALRKSQFGATFTKDEQKIWGDMVPMLENNDDKFDQTLDSLESILNMKLNSRIDEYQRKDDSGGLVSNSNVARKATGQSPSLNPGERGAAAMGDPGKMDRARQVLANPNASPAAKAGAQKYLDDHGAK